MTASTMQQAPKTQDDLTGAWMLVSAVMEDAETKEQKKLWGERPNGHLTFVDGRWLVVQTAEGRKIPRTDEDRSAAFRSMLAYGGRYRADGQTIVIDVDIAWDESWVGTQQVRLYRVDGDQLHIEATPQRYANLGNNPMRGILIWRRVE